MGRVGRGRAAPVRRYPGRDSGTGDVPGHLIHNGGSCVSIVRVGLAESKHFAEGYDAIFGKKKNTAAKPKPAKSAKKSPKKSKPKVSAKKSKKKQ
jgi:hypothetical protein